mgnify:CR=1 FL=1
MGLESVVWSQKQASRGEVWGSEELGFRGERGGEKEEDNCSPTQPHPWGTQQGLGQKLELKALRNMQRHNTACPQARAFCGEKTGAE